MVSSEDGQIFNLVVAAATAVCAFVANKRSITEEEKVCVRVEEGVAGVAAKTIDMPSVPSYILSRVSRRPT